MLSIPQLSPLGDNAVSVSFGNTIERVVNQRVITVHQQLLQQSVIFWLDLIPAYASLTIVYDGVKIAETYKQSPYQFVKSKVEEALAASIAPIVSPPRKMNVPVCYDPQFGVDNAELCKKMKVSKEELVQLHSGNPYHVYMLGFLPGFAYMGSVDKRIAAPRLTKPRWVHAGSVGIAGQQTGIYPMASPGGWNIVGRTPLVLFDATHPTPTLLQAGDEVTFTPISREEFNSYKS